MGIDCSELWEFLRKAIFSKSNLKKDGVLAKPFCRMRTVVREFARKNWRTKLSITLFVRSKARLV